MARIRPDSSGLNIEVLTLECPYCQGTGEMSGSDLHDDMTHCPMCDSYAKTGLWEADCGHAGCQQCITSVETPQGEWSHCDECNAEGEHCNECNDNYIWFMVGEEEIINDYNECEECNTEMCSTCNEDHDPCPVTGVHRAEDIYWNPDSDDEGTAIMVGIVGVAALTLFSLSLAKGYAAGKKYNADDLPLPDAPIYPLIIGEAWTSTDEGSEDTTSQSRIGFEEEEVECFDQDCPPQHAAMAVPDPADPQGTKICTCVPIGQPPSPP